MTNVPTLDTLARQLAARVAPAQPVATARPAGPAQDVSDFTPRPRTGRILLRGSLEA